MENNNGRVGVHGLSWGRNHAALSLVRAHATIAAVAIESPVTEGFLGDDYHQSLFMGVWNRASWWSQKKAPWEIVGLPAKGTGDYDRKEILVMVRVRSSRFPLFDRNPQTFVDIYSADEYDFRKATHSVWHSREFPSHITVSTLKDREK